MLTRLSSPPVIYRDLVMEKLHFPDTGVVMGPVIPAPQALPLPEVVANPGAHLQVRGVPLATSARGGHSTHPHRPPTHRPLGRSQPEDACPRLATGSEEMASIYE